MFDLFDFLNSIIAAGGERDKATAGKGAQCAQDGKGV
jgi:hypothetical protein